LGERFADSFQTVTMKVTRRPHRNRIAHSPIAVRSPRRRSAPLHGRRGDSMTTMRIQTTLTVTMSRAVSEGWFLPEYADLVRDDLKATNIPWPTTQRSVW